MAQDTDGVKPTELFPTRASVEHTNTTQLSKLDQASRKAPTAIASHFTVNDKLGHNYIGHNYIGHNYIGLHYIGHKYIGLHYIGHNYSAITI